MITGKRLKLIRQRLGESQAGFAIRFGVDQSTIHRWETHGIPERGATPIAVEHVVTEIEGGRSDGN